MRPPSNPYCLGPGVRADAPAAVPSLDCLGWLRCRCQNGETIADSNERPEILDTEKQLLNFLFSKGANFSKWQEPRRVDFRSNDDDDDDLPHIVAEKDQVILWVSTGSNSASGGGTLSTRAFGRFEPYWALLMDAANSGSKERMRTLISGLRNAVSIEIGLQDQSEITVEATSGPPITLRKKDLNRVEVRGNEVDGISIIWTNWCLAPDARKNPVLSKLIYGDTINVWQHLKRNTRRLIKLPGIASDNNNPCATICPGRSLAGLSGCD